MTTAANATCSQTSGATHPLDVERIRAEFPALHQMVHGRPLVYLDNAATSQKPRAVIEAISDHYRQNNSNVHRGVHELSQRATAAYEAARLTVQRFLNAGRHQQILFVRGCTEAINLVAQSWGRPNLKPGDEILISHMEHHSNIVPWQILSQQTQATLKVAPINDAGELVLEEFRKRLNERTKLVSITHISNALGTINPIKKIIDLAHDAGAVVLVDGAQAVPHLCVDVQRLDCDFYAFSGHKMYGPMGIGVLYGKEALLESMPPYQSGGDMIKSVRFENTIYNDLPYKFEAGTPNAPGAIGLATAIDYVQSIGLENIIAYENDLLAYATSALQALEGVRLIGTASEKASVVSFVLNHAHAHDVGTILDLQAVAIRSGHHCAQPVMDHFGVPATVRASLAFYNSRQDIDALVNGLREVIEVFK